VHPEIVHVDALVVGPSRDLGRLAIQNADRLPTGVRYLLRGLGATEGTGANLLSYLLFDRQYCRELLALGYSDALARRDEIGAFLAGDIAGYLPFFPAELLS
jgi:NTE family protein